MLMRNDRDVMGNLKSVEYIKKMVLRSVAQVGTGSTRILPSEPPVSVIKKSSF